MQCCKRQHSPEPLKPSRRQRQICTTTILDSSLIEFDLNGKTMDDYCPHRCTICLLGILKNEAKAGPCITHVFHKYCIERWACYRIERDKLLTCPICMTEHEQKQYINTDEL